MLMCMTMKPRKTQVAFLIFDLPNLIQKKGGHVRVFNNHIHHNNYPNFAPKGNIVGKVPLGTGVMVLATNNVEIYNNRIINNRTAGTAIVSYYISEIPIKDDFVLSLPGSYFYTRQQLCKKKTKNHDERKDGIDVSLESQVWKKCTAYYL